MLYHFSILDLASEEFTILNWIAVLVSNRVFRPGTPVAGRARRYLEENYMVNVNAYDIVRGYRADDAYYDFADAFLNNAVTVEQLARAMRLGKLGEQIVLKSRLAFERIEFIGYSAADSSYYYPARKVRSEQADQEFRMMSEVLDDGLYMFIASSICRRLENGEPKYLIGMSGIELANRSGVSLRSIQMYEQRNKDINKAQSGFLASISRTLGCRIEDLLEI